MRSKGKLDFLYRAMMADSDICHEVVADLRDTRTSRDDEPIPDHSTLAKHAVDVPDEWMDAVQIETARRLAEAARSTGPHRPTAAPQKPSTRQSRSPT